MKVRKIIFNIIIAYILIFSILFTYKVFDTRKASNKKLESDTNIEHVNFINDSLKKINNTDKCSTSIKKAIESESRRNYGLIKTYKDLYLSYYGIDDDFRVNTCGNVSRNCNLDNHEEFKNKFLPHCLYGVSVVEYWFYNEYMDNINIKIDFPLKALNSYSSPSLKTIRSKTKVDLRSQLITEQREYIEMLLSIAGGTYE